MPAEVPKRVIADIRFIGRSGGAVKALRGFKKKHHTLPDAANAVTNAFLGRLCQGELEVEAEKLFQTVRSELGYKRRDITLTLTSPQAVLSAKDFTLEILYVLDAATPTEFAVTQTLLDLKDGDFARTEKFNAIFAGRFSELSFCFKQGANVEAVIDAIEGLDETRAMRVDYPSDCSECTITVEGVDAQVRCTDSSLDMVFPRAGAPRELLAQFTAVRSAFGLSKALAGLMD
ncbi:MAG: hypothetical protein K9M98_10670 [Cephaloticoccus sp.]|nr:hypothetical protein [Cephaloticoccus sp.]MCF7760954.1 hypothetical protein [Cephaloticoccus sp.]